LTKELTMRSSTGFSICVVLLAATPCRSARAQAELRPLSVTKLRVNGPETVPERRLEVGLLWQMGWYDERFDGSGEVQDSNLDASRGELGLRLVVGLLDGRMFGAELGLLLPVVFEWSESSITDEKSSAMGLSDVPVGLKVRFFSTREASLALATSVTTPTGDRASGLGRGHTRLAQGLLFSSQPTSWLSIDSSFSAGVALGVGDDQKGKVPTWGLAHEVGLALLLPPDLGLTPCVELGWTMNTTPDATTDASSSAHKLVLNLGLNYQLNDRIILMQGAQVDLAGKSAERGAMWFMSFLFLG
jgi:hypothetical protein